MRINLRHGISGIILAVFVLLALGCGSMLQAALLSSMGGTTSGAVQDTTVAEKLDINKAVAVGFDEFISTIESAPTNTLYSFDAYIRAINSSQVTALKEPRIVDGSGKAVPPQPALWIGYDSGKHQIEGRYKADQTYKVYVFFTRSLERNQLNSLEAQKADMNSFLEVVSNVRGLKLFQIDGLKSDADMAHEAEQKAAEAKAKEAADAKAKAERLKARDEKGKMLAKGYTYHGLAEDDQNRRLFENGALESGHAYYISGFRADSHEFGWVHSARHMVNYPSQKVKGEVLGAPNESTVDNKFGITVVVAGGKAPLFIPVVLGWLE